MVESLRSQVRDYTQFHSNLHLVGILTGNQPDVLTYSSMLETTLRSDKIQYTVHRMETVQPEQVQGAIESYNSHSAVHGILVFYPIFPQVLIHSKQPRIYLNQSTGVHYKTIDDYLRDCVDPCKDVEGLRQSYEATWQKTLFQSRSQHDRTVENVYLPCTAAAILNILETYHHPNPQLKFLYNTPNSFQSDHWEGNTATIINRSNILGRPLAALLALQGAHIFSVDEYSIIEFCRGGKLRRCDKHLDDCIRESNIVVTAVPGDDFMLNINCIRDNTTVVDVSGNLNPDTLLHKKSGIKLVRNVGRATIAALEHALVRKHIRQNNKT